MNRVSVVMACYQAEAFIDRAIASVEAQTVSDWQLIIVDDASQDRTWDIAQLHADKDDRIKLVRLPDNRGPGAARKVALEHATGEWIAILDADDAFRPDRLGRLVEAAEMAGADIAFDNLTLFDDHAGIETGPALPVTAEVRALTFRDVIESERAISPFRLGFLKPLIRRSFLVENGITYDPELRSAEDFDIYARSLLAGAHAIFLGEPLYIYTTQVGARSRKRSRGTHSRFIPGAKLAVIDRLMAHDGLDRESEDFRALLECQKWQRKRQIIHEMAVLRHNGRIGAFLGMAMANPAAALDYIATSRAGKSLFRFRKVVE